MSERSSNMRGLVEPPDRVVLEQSWPWRYPAIVSPKYIGSQDLEHITLLLQACLQHGLVLFELIQGCGRNLPLALAGYMQIASDFF